MTKKGKSGGLETKESTQKVVEYSDGLTIDGKNIEFVSDVKATPVTENYIEMKVTFYAKSYTRLPNKLRNSSSDRSRS